MDTLDDTLRVNLPELIDTESFGEVCRSFHSLFSVPVRIFDMDSNLVVDSVHSLSPCRHLQKFSGGKNKCSTIKATVKRSQPSEKETILARCFCGLEYAIVPILFQNQLVGKIVLGPYRPHGLSEPPENIAQVIPEIDKNVLAQKLAKLRGVSKGAINKIATTFRSTIDVILFSSHKAHITTQMHISSVRESYRELAKKNKQLEDMNERMKEFEQLKSSFLATVSHELRTPLTSIIGYSDMLSEGIAGELTEEQKQFVETIKTKGDELLRLISSILDFSQIETGHVSLQLDEVDPQEIIKLAVARNHELARRRGTRLSVELPKELPLVQLDVEKMITALSHIIENAIKFSPPGGLVHVSAVISPSDQSEDDEQGFGFVLMSTPDNLEITVEDYGIGITDEDKARIFAPFAQVDNSSTREHDGAGLGLAVVTSYIESHGGKVLVESCPEEGSRFIVRIPITARE